MSLPAQCLKCGARIIFCSVDAESHPLSGVATCLECGEKEKFTVEVPSLSQITIQVECPPVPECGACPECNSLNVGIVGDYFENDEGNWLDFDCHDCKHAFKVSGPIVRKLVQTLSGDGLSPTPFSLN